MKTLHLTTPLMHGPEVKHAQVLLAANVFHQNYQPGPPDGEFGEATARACARAHYWIGDAVSQPVYADRLEGFLTGRVKLPAMNASRRAHRLELAKQQPLGEKALAYLTTHLGETEHPAGSNYIEFASGWYMRIKPGQKGGPWCAMAVTRSMVEAGSKSFVRGSAYAFVPYVVNDARAGRNGLSVTHAPVKGDPVAYDWERDGEADHIGLFERWVVKGRTFVAVEGNTSSDDHGSQSNGGGVFRRERSVSLVQAFIHVSR